MSEEVHAHAGEKERAHHFYADPRLLAETMTELGLPERTPEAIVRALVRGHADPKVLSTEERQIIADTMIVQHYLQRPNMGPWVSRSRREKAEAENRSAGRGGADDTLDARLDRISDKLTELGKTPRSPQEISILLTTAMTAGDVLDVMSSEDQQGVIEIFEAAMAVEQETEGTEGEEEEDQEAEEEKTEEAEEEKGGEEQPEEKEASV